MTTSVLAYNDTTTTSPIGQAYADSCSQYEALANKKQKDTIVLAGYGCGLSVSRDSLLCKQGFTHESTNNTNQAQTLYRGVHGVKSIIILSDSGNISLDAIRWTSSENITISIIDRDGSLQQTLTPEQVSNAKLRKAQYLASDSDKGSYIAYRLICKKAQAQLDLLEKHPELPDSERALEIFSDSLKWLELPDLPRWQDIDYMRTFEGRLAKAYWGAVEGLEIRYEKAYSKQIPPHWKSVTDRSSPLSHGHGARHAVNPFHALLNYAYAVIESQVRQALVSAGFDVACGFLHADKLYRDSLVYDMIELFRSSVDAQILKLIQTTTFKKGDFIPMHDGNIRLNQQLARYVVSQCQIPQARIEEGVRWLKSLLD